MTQKLPEWVMQRLMAGEPGMENIPPALYNSWKAPEDEADLKRMAEQARSLVAKLTGSSEVSPEANTYAQKQIPSDAQVSQAIKDWAANNL